MCIRDSAQSAGLGSNSQKVGRAMSNYEVEGPFGTPVPVSEQQAELRHEELSLFDSTAVAVSSLCF